MTAVADARRSPSTFWQWIRHHLASIVATVVDYGVMVGCVQLLGLRPVPATIIGGVAGGVTNFTFGRVFTYRAHESVVSQSWRYVIVWGGSLAWNGFGEHIFSDVFGMNYVVARVITSIIVSNAWNYPLQRFFVFSHHNRQTEHQTSPPP